MSERKVGLCIVASPGHQLAGHPEGPHRFANLQQLLQGEPQLPLVELNPEPAPRALLAKAHSEEYLSRLELTTTRGSGILDHGDTYYTPDSFEAARTACGGVLTVLDSLLGGDVTAGFAIVRPPGHHATAEKAMGFCLLNNIAVAASAALEAGLEQLMILDIDVHHGNGTQDIFYHDQSVLYLSTHQRGIYPGSGHLQEIGSGTGEGSTVNCPLPWYAGDKAFSRIHEEIIRPMARRFKPQCLLVSVGFDAHWRDPLAGLQLTLSGYFQLVRGFVELADELCESRILFCLEGGYDPPVLAAGIRGVLHALSGFPSPKDPFGPAPEPEPDIGPLLRSIRETHAIV